ncbi:MAG: LysR family transcriptional regulator [Burkholderiales bacterium]|nr:LysR family transcriptional regulator [Burkholderiales bacterium]
MDQVFLLQQAQALARHRNFARAAASINLSQPSLTRGIASLEASLGVRLFERDRRGATPTAFGRVLLERAESLLRAHADLRRELQLLAGLERGSLSIGAGPYLAESLVAETVARMVSAHPQLTLECIAAPPNDVVAGVRAGNFDIGVAGGGDYHYEADFVVQDLTPLAVVFGCRPGHPLLRERRPTLARLLQFPLVTTRLRGSDALSALRARGLPADRRRRGESPDFSPNILVNSLGVARRIARGSDAIIPGFGATLAEDFEAGRLVRIEIAGRATETQQAVFHRRDRPLAPAAAAFIDTLRTVDAQMHKPRPKLARAAKSARRS